MTVDRISVQQNERGNWTVHVYDGDEMVRLTGSGDWREALRLAAGPDYAGPSDLSSAAKQLCEVARRSGAPVGIYRPRVDEGFITWALTYDKNETAE